MLQRPYRPQWYFDMHRVLGPRHPRSSSCVLGIALLLGACTDQPSTGPRKESFAPESRSEMIALAQRTASSQLDQAAHGRTDRGAEDEILRLEAAVPGIGGLYVDSATGRVTVFVREAASKGRAIAAIRALAERLDRRLPEAAWLGGQDAVVRIGEFAFSELVGWSTVLGPELIRVPSFVSLDADERRNRVVVTLSDIAKRGEVERIALAAGMPSAALLVVAGAPAVALQSDLRSDVRPLSAGFEFQTVPAARCTIGWDVTTPQGETGFLTAGHCSPGSTGSGTTGESMLQIRDYVGNVALNPTWFTGCYTSATGGYFSGYCSEADALFVSTSAYNAQKRVAMTSDVGTSSAPGSLNLAGYYNALSSPVFAWAGVVADKTGRTTGTTRGTVQGTCEAVLVNGSAYHYVITCADRVTGAGAGQGDSGAPVYRLIGTGIYPLGTLFAGGPMNEYDFGDNTQRCTWDCTYWYSPWANIQNRLARTFNPQP